MGSFALPFLFDGVPQSIKENLMRKMISILFLVFIAVGLSACAKPPSKPVDNSEAQRSHSKEAQDELSSEVHK